MSSLRQPLTAGLRAALQNARPAAVIIVIMIGLVVGYEHWTPLRTALDHIAATRERVGILFGILSTAAFGGALPLVFRRFLLKQPAGPNEVLFAVGFWAYKGVEMGLFYDLQAYVWGADNNLPTILVKTLVDQLIYAPFIAVPNMTLAYVWLECGYSWKRTREALRKEGFLRRALPVLIGNAMLWLPAMALIYLLPTALQLPLANLVLTFWVLVLMLVARREEALR